jgi:hypothetical protein
MFLELSLIGTLVNGQQLIPDPFLWASFLEPRNCELPKPGRKRCIFAGTPLNKPVTWSCTAGNFCPTPAVRFNCTSGFYCPANAAQGKDI